MSPERLLSIAQFPLKQLLPSEKPFSAEMENLNIWGQTQLMICTGSRTGTPLVQTLLPSPNLRYQEREETPLESDDSDFETPARFRTEPVA